MCTDCAACARVARHVHGLRGMCMACLCPLVKGCPLFRVSTIGGSTVVTNGGWVWPYGCVIMAWENGCGFLVICAESAVLFINVDVSGILASAVSTSPTASSPGSQKGVEEGGVAGKKRDCGRGSSNQ